jgi:hypothetical protein
MPQLNTTNREPFGHNSRSPEQSSHHAESIVPPSASPFVARGYPLGSHPDPMDLPDDLPHRIHIPHTEPVASTHQGDRRNTRSPEVRSPSSNAASHIALSHEEDHYDLGHQNVYPRARILRLMPSPPPGPPHPGIDSVDLTPSWVYREQTGFFACYDVIHHTLGFLPLGDVRKCVGVCRFWEGIARERLGGRAEEIRQFVHVYNENVEDRVVRASNFVQISQPRKAQLLFFSLNLCPCAILPWLYLKIPYQWPWCISDLAFDICLGVCVSLTFLVAGIGMVKIGPKFSIVEILIIAAGYLVVAAAVVVYTLSQRFQVLRSTPTVNLTLSTLAAFTILAYSLPLMGSTGMFLIYYLYTGNLIHRQQIRNPLSDAPEDNGGGYFAKLRRAVTLDEVELMMSKEAELKARQERTSPSPAST